MFVIFQFLTNVYKFEYKIIKIQFYIAKSCFSGPEKKFYIILHIDYLTTKSLKILLFIILTNTVKSLKSWKKISIRKVGNYKQYPIINKSM